MVGRVARTGRRAGSRFWGCSTFPRCRGAVNIGEASPLAGEDRETGADLAHFRARRTWTEHARRPGWESFYAAAGGRLRSWDPTFNADAGTANALSHAAFYLSSRQTESQADPSAAVFVDVMRRILTRGDRPPVDPMIEASILESCDLLSDARPSRDPGDAAVRLAAAAQLPSQSETGAAVTWREGFEFDEAAKLPDGKSLLSSPLEKVFMLDEVGKAFGPTAGHWFHPQASLGSLTDSDGDYRRVDFLVHHPAIRPHVVEVDGMQHGLAKEVDRVRDEALAAQGIVAERAGSGDLNRLAKTELAGVARVADPPLPRTIRLVWAAPIAHRIARAIVEGIANGWLSGTEWRIRVTEPAGVAAVAVHSAAEQLAAVAEVWSARVAPDLVTVLVGDERYRLSRIGADIYQYANGQVAGGDESAPVDLHIVVDAFHGPWHKLPDAVPRTIVVRSAYLPIQLREGRLEGGARKTVPDVNRIPRQTLERLLLGVFAKREFYPAGAEHPRGQEVAIRRLLGGRDAAVLLPTGAGKSLIYQFTSLLLPGRTLVIDPIVALIDDQLDGLASQGIDRAIGITWADTIDGGVKAKLEAVANGDALFCFVSPERLQQRRFRDAIRALTVASPINLCVVDEAHCVSEWGHDFRTSYLDIGRVLREVSADSRNVAPPMLALTGTASRSVLRDMLIELDIDRSDPEAIVAPQNFDRPELTFSVVQAREDELLSRVVGTLRSLPSRFGVPEGTFFQEDGPETYSGILFSQTVNPSRTRPDGGLMKLQGAVQEEFRTNVGLYSGREPRDWEGLDWNGAKRKFAAAFKGNRSPVLVATKAYGMGIDKPNVRYIVHSGVPGSIEAYYQEAGRAGRDRQPAHCVIVHDPLDRGFWDWRLGISFQGIERDVQQIQRTLGLIGHIGSRRTVFIPRSKDDALAQDEERAIHRLKLLGVVRDYLVDWGGAQFELLLADIEPESVATSFLQYVRRTQPARVRAFEKELGAEPPSDLPARVMATGRRLVTFIYETVVNARRRALDEMVQLVEEASSDSEIRQRILDYLELGQVAGQLEPLVDAPTFYFQDWLSLYHELDTVDDAREWRGATARFLESSPDHPGLLFGRALAEAVVPDGRATSFAENVAPALTSATGSYLATLEDTVDFLEWMLRWLHERRAGWAPICLIVAERFLGDQHLDYFEGLEADFLGDSRTSNADEMAVIYARRIGRHADTLEYIASRARELAA